MPDPFLSITRNRETNLAPIPVPSLNLTPVAASGSMASTEPTHFLPVHPEIYVVAKNQ